MIYEERIQNIRNAMRGEAATHVPILADFETSYACEYAQLDFMKASWHYPDILKAYEKVLEDFEIDATFGLGWIPPQKSILLGSRTWVQNHENGTMQHPEVMALSNSEYPELIADPVACIVKNVLPRMYSALGENKEHALKAIAQAMLFEKSQMTDFYNQLFAITYEHAVPIYYGSMFYAPFDLIGDHLRGLTQISLDMRRKKEALAAACEALAPVMIRYIENTLPVDEDGLSCACAFVHLPPMISPGNFEKFFWPTFKKVCDTLTEKGHTLYLQFQGDYTDGRYLDYYAELPQHKVILSFEKQDFARTLKIFEGKNMISCAYPLDYLTHASLQECLDKAKELMDIGMGHGQFYFGFNKAPFHINEAAPEKMKAVLHFVREYGKY
ncbi:uroporphyrinogen decarboxylase family protein [Eubacterium sp. 1001713B170207_170306_E7]|uniref:uroporphyrinogen decarboxylase family protein n=1 Tax=Eubacterium sp. 1001713B170207_170306_E7 TaxID=2787097 RepID=UPI001898BF27|nr:uroporphyrinogen decarboxylase family protein [Eubacterium sp. 1001713B170207_170306_E7]